MTKSIGLRKKSRGRKERSGGGDVDGSFVTRTLNQVAAELMTVVLGSGWPGFFALNAVASIGLEVILKSVVSVQVFSLVRIGSSCVQSDVNTVYR